MLINAELKDDFIKDEIEEIILLMDEVIENINFFKSGKQKPLNELKEKTEQILKVLN